MPRSNTRGTLTTMDQISIEQLRRKFPDASLSTLKANLKNIALQEAIAKAPDNAPISVVHPKENRIRQSTQPKLNKTEQRGISFLRAKFPEINFRIHAKTYQLANGVKYTPEATAIVNGVETAWEVKGPKIWDDATVKIKVAANQFPEIEWYMIWEEKSRGSWLTQRILPLEDE